MVRAPDLKSIGPWVQIPFWPLADAVLSCPEFNFSATLVNSQLIFLPPVGILNYVYLSIYLSLYAYTGPEKPQWGVASEIYTVVLCITLCIAWIAQPLSQGLLSYRPLEQSRRGKMRDPGNEAGIAFILLLPKERGQKYVKCSWSECSCGNFREKKFMQISF